MKMNEDLEKEFTLSEEIMEQIVARVKGMVVEAESITLPTSPVEAVRPEEVKKTSGEDVKTLEVTFPEFLQDSVVPLLKLCLEKVQVVSTVLHYPVSLRL
ncbi:hypothetical protein AXG93_4537s1000 [Marchantia polymorpha subsp. ruderalis]|uniref:Uncharacterized protein n=1 Tax=Marchantia polymorpha subsp. ruderalis TaxID=1480154 RepID=A0A176VQ70_MARPO|nr:hypothetical protein AXG93_4537s1000 [Marchantia polymorpha subsp. ruderalis]